MAATCRIVQRSVALGDPHDCTDAADQLTILHAVFDTLVKRQGQTFVPHLAESWYVNEDATRWEFTLRATHLFHDGSPCDADAVSQSLQRMARADKGYTLGSPGVWRQYLGTANVETLDARRLRVTLAEPIADLLDILEQGFIVAPSCHRAWDRGEASPPIGSGPYRLAGKSETTRIAERAKGHFAPGPHDKIEWIAEPDADKRLAMLRDGAVEVANDLPTSCLSQPGAGDFTFHEYVSPVAIIYLLNAASGPLSDPRLRRALSLAVDRNGLIDTVLGGHARPLFGFVSPGHFGAGASDPLPHDREAAFELLAEAGFADGLTLGVDCPTRLPEEAEKLTETLRAQLSKVGIMLDIHIHKDREAYAHMVRRKEIRDLCVFDSSPMSTFRVLYEKLDARVAGSWWQGYRNQTVEGLIDAARVTVAADDRAKIYAAAFAEIQSDPAWLTLYNPTRVIGLACDRPDFSMPVDGVVDVTALPLV